MRLPDRFNECSAFQRRFTKSVTLIGLADAYAYVKVSFSSHAHMSSLLFNYASFAVDDLKIALQCFVECRKASVVSERVIVWAGDAAAGSCTRGSRRSSEASDKRRSGTSGAGERKEAVCRGQRRRRCREKRRAGGIVFLSLVGGGGGDGDGDARERPGFEKVCGWRLGEGINESSRQERRSFRGEARMR